MSSHVNTRINSALIAALSITFVAVSTVASDARPSTRSYTCSGVKNFISQRGAVVMNHKSSSLYQRFVSRRSFCDRGETTKRFSVPTKSGKCSLKICAEPIFFLND